jgi:hypothetical protein
MICTICMAQKYLRRWIFVKAIGRYLCTKILKTVNLSSRQMECTHRTLLLHETRNTTQHLQSVFVFMKDDIKSNIKVWLDDCLLHTKMEDDLLETLSFFFEKCQKHGLKLNASKYVFLQQRCGTVNG